MATSPGGEELAGLLGRAAAGDRTAYGAFVDSTSPTALRLALVLTGSRQDAEELLVRCYSAAWPALAEHPGSGRSPMAWLLARVQAAAQARA